MHHPHQRLLGMLVASLRYMSGWSRPTHSRAKLKTPDLTAQGAPAKVIDFDIAEGIKAIMGLEGYASVLLLVRLEGQPLGYVSVPEDSGHCSSERIRDEIVRQLPDESLSALLDHLLDNEPTVTSRPDAASSSASGADDPMPSLKVVICSHDRPRSLELCLHSVLQMKYSNFDVLVIDNAPSNTATKDLLSGHFPDVQYALEPRLGLARSRNRAIQESSSDIIAFTDDDVVVDPEWATALAKVFATDEEVMAVTGLVAPYELETEAQIYMEQRRGYSRGFNRVRHTVASGSAKGSVAHLAAGKFGTGANMAFRRSLFDEIGPFDPALGAGTLTHGCEEIEMFFRLIDSGHVLVYEPGAIVWHRHFRELRDLERQSAGYAVAFTSYLVKVALEHPSYGLAAARVWLREVWRSSARPLVGSFVRPDEISRDLSFAQLRGFLSGLVAYPRAKRIALAP